MVSDLSSGATTNVSVEAWCDTPAYTQDRTTKYGLTKGEKKYDDNCDCPMGLIPGLRGQLHAALSTSPLAKQCVPVY